MGTLKGEWIDKEEAKQQANFEEFGIALLFAGSSNNYNNLRIERKKDGRSVPISNYATSMFWRIISPLFPLWTSGGYR